MRLYAIIIGLLLSVLIPINAMARHGMRGGRGHEGIGRHHAGQPAAFAESPYFGAPENCAGCHNPLWDAFGEDVSLYDDWAPTMMAQAARDPLWQAKVASEVLRNPKIGLQLQERCARCHTPMADTETRFNYKQTRLLDDGFLSPQNTLFELAADGVSCTVCHQVLKTKLGTDQSYTGKFMIDSITQRPDRPIFGPYPNPFQMPMRRHSGFTPYSGPQVRQSELCATCHTLFVPVTDADGQILGESPEQTPYIEWQNSSFGDNLDGDDISCQQCHMPPAGGPVVISRMPHHRLNPRAPFAKHHFVGGNTFVLKMIRDAWAEMEPAGHQRRFDVTIARTLRQLQHRTANISIDRIRQTGDRLEFSVVVINQTGHKFPTGIPARRAWLHLNITDAQGDVVFESGKPGSDGAISGNAADADPSAFEQHYQVIDRADQVQIYESILANTDGEVTYALSRGIEHIKENRLLPMGFDKDAVPGAIRPHDAALTDADFEGGRDTTQYRIDSSDTAFPLTIRAELLYQEAGFAFIRDLLNFEARSPIIADFAALYRQADKAPVSIARAQAVFTP